PRRPHRRADPARGRAGPARARTRDRASPAGPRGELAMSFLEGAGLLPYLGVFVAAVIEGEVVFVAATVLVQIGRLDATGVFPAAALGGSVGDQLYFYVLRGRLGWLDRFPTWSRRRDLIIDKVRTNANTMILACRFLPGLRVAIPAACAYADVSPVRFTTLS